MLLFPHALVELTGSAKLVGAAIPILQIRAQVAPADFAQVPAVFWDQGTLQFLGKPKQAINLSTTMESTSFSFYCLNDYLLKRLINLIK